MRRRVVLAVLLTGVLTVSAAMADSVSEMLEKGIYTEQTVGDLDKAISIYEKVIAEAKAGHLLAAQAQFQIGQCLLKKGKKAEATAAFEKLVRDFPDAKDLVAKARKHIPAGLPLEPVPWVDGEELQLSLRMATGMEIGTVVYTVQSAEHAGRKVWRVRSHTLVSLARMTGASRVDADWNTFQPIESHFRNSLLGNCLAKYSDNRVDVVVEGPNGTKTTKRIDLSKVVYDNEQAVDVIRRLPLAPGYKTVLTVLGELGVGEVAIPLEVQAKETVKVPAGQFECFKIHLGLVNQTFWYAADPHRYLVKFSASGVDAVLTAIGQTKPGEPRRYEDRKLGYSLAAPNEWFFAPVTPLGDKHTAVVHLLDPEAIANGYFFVDQLTGAKTDRPDMLRGWLDAGIDEAAKVKKDFKVRADSRTERTIAGLPAASAVADYTEGKRKMVDYYTYVDGSPAGLKFKFEISVPQDRFEELRKSLDAIVESLKVKQP